MNLIALLPILFTSIYGSLCLKGLRGLIGQSKGYEIHELKEVINPHNSFNRELKILGTIPGEDETKELAVLEYTLDDDELTIDTMFTNFSLSGYGIQKQLFGEMLERYPQVNRINSTMTGTNEMVIIRRLMELFLREDLPMGRFNPMEEKFEKHFEDCCGDLFFSLSEDQKQSFIRRALEYTPAHKIRSHYDLRLCEDNPVDIIPNRRLGEFNLFIYTSYCR